METSYSEMLRLMIFRADNAVDDVSPAAIANQFELLEYCVSHYFLVVVCAPSMVTPLYSDAEVISEE